MFSTGLSPALAHVLVARIQEVRGDEPGRARLAVVAKRLRSALTIREGRVGGYGPIIPWILGSPADALAASRHLQDHGIFAPAIRPPTVPLGTSRLRLTASSTLSDVDLELVERALADLRP